MPGPPKQPKKFKELHGNPGKKSLQYNEAEATGDPEILGPLNDDGIEHWDLVTRHAKDWGMGRIDSHALYSLCRWWEEYRKADRLLSSACPAERRGLMIDTTAAFKSWSTLSAKFGMTPSDRTKLVMDIKEQGDSRDDLLKKANS